MTLINSLVESDVPGPPILHILYKSLTVYADVAIAMHSSVYLTIPAAPVLLMLAHP